MTTMITTSYLMCSMTTSSRTFYLMCSMTTSSSTSSFPSLMSSMSCKSKKPRKMRQKKKTRNWGWQLSSWQMFFFGGGKCPNLGVVNVRILGVVNVLLANDSQSLLSGKLHYIHTTGTRANKAKYLALFCKLYVHRIGANMAQCTGWI